MDRSIYGAHEAIKAGRPTEQTAAYLEAVERIRLDSERAARVHSAKVSVLRVLVVINAVLWAAHYARGVL